MIAAIFSAFPQELRHIRKLQSAQKPEIHPFPLQGKQLHPCNIIAVQTGVGARNMEAAFQRVLQKHRPDIVVSAGFGGALYEDAEIGDIVWSSRSFFFGGKSALQLQDPVENTILSSDLSGRIKKKLHEWTKAKEGCIVTLSELTTKTKIKNMMPDNLPFPVCDMETFYLAQLSHQNCVPFLALRSITDRLDEDVPPELLTVTDCTGQYHFSRAVGILVGKPVLIPASIRLGINAARASKSLGKAVDSLMIMLSDFSAENEFAE